MKRFLALALLVSGCAVRGVGTDSASLSTGAAFPKSTEGQSGGTPFGSNTGESADFTTAPRKSGDSSANLGSSPANAPDSTCQGGSLSLFATSIGPIAAGDKGVYLRGEIGIWTAVASAFPCGTGPLAIASGATPSLFAVAADGLYESAGGTWSKVATGSGFADLDLTPDGTAGAAVQEDGGLWGFDGTTWTKRATVAGGLGFIRVLSATESYALGPAGFGMTDGATWTPIARPDAANPVAGLAVRRSGSSATLVATTRLGIYRRSAGSWVAEIGPSSTNYLGVPAFGAGGTGFVADLGNAGGKAFAYSASAWAASVSPPDPLDTVAITPGGVVTAITAGGTRLLALDAGAWTPIQLP